MEFLNSSKACVTFIPSYHYVKNKKTIYDIVKFTITDDDIDYNLDKESIKNMKFFDSSCTEQLSNHIFNSNEIESALTYHMTSDGAFYDENGDVLLDKASYIQVEILNEEDLFVEFGDKKFISSLEVDGVTVKNFEKSYIYIKKMIKIFLSPYATDGYFNIIALKSENLNKEFNINYGM